VVFSNPVGAERARVKVLILPFDMHSRVDISEERRSLMETVARSLDASGAEVVGIERIKELVLEKGVTEFDEEAALELSRRAGADFALLGSLTLLGETLSADWRILDAKTEDLIGFYYKSAGSLTELLQKVEVAAPEVYERMVEGAVERPVTMVGKIARITVVGNRRIDSEAVLKRLVSKVGDEFSPDSVKEDIRAIHGMGFFEDVKVSLLDTIAGKELRFEVKEKPLVKSMAISGNKEIKDERILEVIALKENTILDNVALKEDTERIRFLYEIDGYYLTTVEPEVTIEEVGATVTYVIEEGQMVKVKTITIIGNEHISDRQIKRLMRTKKKGFLSFLTDSGKFNELVFENDLGRIAQRYFNKGYVKADILDHKVLLSDDKRWFHITISIFEGERFNLGEIDIAGDIITTREELLEKLKIESGEVFNRSKITKGIEALGIMYGDEGYANAEFKPLSRVNPEEKTVDLTIEITKKDLVYIERIDITGNVRTRDKVIRREIEVTEGSLFNASGLKRSRNNLRRLGYFEGVTIDRSEGSEPDKMKLDVKVKERPTGAFSVGVGYSSLDKFIGSASLSQSNLFGTGLKFNFSVLLSAISSRYTLSFTEPWLFDKPLSAGIDIFDTARDFPDFDIAEKGFGLRFGFPLIKRTTRGSLNYTLKEVDVSEVDPDATRIIRDQEGTRIVGSVKGQIKRDTRDDAFFPTEGSITTVSAKVAGSIFGGNTNFVKFEGDALKFFPLPWWDLIFSARGQAGYLFAYKGQDEPIYERYFLGGINSLRGFESRSVGPRDPGTDEIIGGSVKLVANFELLFPLFSRQNLRGVLFFDIGNAFDDDIDFGELREGAGAGVRWFSPLGPLRLELGYNLDRREDERQSVWEFSIGGSF
jgi:outer membrane protein insertion porin family